MEENDMESAPPGPGNGKSKLDTLSKEDLIKFAKRQMSILQKLKSKYADLEKEVEVLKGHPSESSQDQLIQELTERVNAALFEKAEIQQTLMLLRKENEKNKKQAHAMEDLADLQKKLDNVNKEHAEKMKVMETKFDNSEAKYREELEFYKKQENERKEKEGIQRQRLMEEFNYNIEVVRQEYDKTIANLQQDLEMVKKEWAAETETLKERHKMALEKSHEDLERLHEEMASLNKKHETVVRDLEEQLEVNTVHFEMEREKLLLLNDELAEQLALKESYLQDVQEEEEDLNKNGDTKDSRMVEMLDNSALEDQNNEMDRLRLTLQDIQSQNTMLQEELAFLSNVKSELENELQHLKEEFSMEKEEMEFKINEMQMTKEDSDSCLEKDAHSMNQQGTVSLCQHEPELQALKELYQTEMRELEAHLSFSAEHYKEMIIQEIKDSRNKFKILTDEKNAIISEYEHIKETLKNLELVIADKASYFLKQYSAMKEETTMLLQKLQEDQTNNDRLITKPKISDQTPNSSELIFQMVVNEDNLIQPQVQNRLVQEIAENIVMPLDTENKTTLETETILDECKFVCKDNAQFGLQKLEELSVALESPLLEGRALMNCIVKLKGQMLSLSSEKEQLCKHCNTLVQDLAALQTTYEQSQATLNKLKITADEEKAELQKDLHSVLEQRDALRKDLESSERKLLGAQLHISEVMHQNYSMTLEDDKEEVASISVMLDRLLSRIQEDKRHLQKITQVPVELIPEQHLEIAVPNESSKDLQDVETEIQIQEGHIGVLVVRDNEPPDEECAQETNMKSFQQNLIENESVPEDLKEEISCSQKSECSCVSENIKKIGILEKVIKEKDERINKIKALAVKARKELEISKKEASELKKELEVLKAERDKLSDSVKVIIHGAEDYKNLMIDYDKQIELLDIEKVKLDAAEKLNADLTKKMQAAAEQNKQLLCEREDMMARMETLQSNVLQLEAQTLELHKLKSGLERDLETERQLKEQKTKDYQSAVKEAEDLNALLHKREKQLQLTEQELEQLRKDAQQSTLLDMEMADYERLVKELNCQISDKNKLIEEQEYLIQAHKDKEEKLVKEIESLKSLVDTAEEKASKMKQLLVKTKKDLADAKKEEVSQMIIQSSLKGELEAMQNQLENCKIQCSDLTADQYRLQEQLKSVNDQHQKAINSYQHHLTTLQEELRFKKAELESTLSEFEGYKVRVHNVLRQQKNRSSTQSSGEISKQEIEHMHKTLEQLRSKLQETQLNLQSSNGELQQIHTEHDLLLEQHNKMLQQTITKEAELRERVLSLHSENAALRSEHSQSVSQLTAQAEALRSSFREQVHHLQVENRSTVETLQQQISGLEAQIFQLQKEPANTGLAPVQQSRKPQMDRKFTELPLFDLQSMAREEGEGMETTETESVSTAGIPPPSLEQLLTFPDPKQEPFVWQVEPTKEELTKKLGTVSRSMEHMNSLLHESEATNAILLEQNNLLKSELRRLERNQEREKSLANLEYLKNVLLQFIFLRSGSEKQALLPVINTMLQLSPEEKSKLAAIAQGEEEAAGSRGSGWTSYLHSWSGIR
ncbi:GRIP and coiled-coil domain-containing protein 2 isoform X2 [Hoplias malabaricus]|uniref:GRIP and coiled-coil domain-containing protein 2 isoform X2 n=1 Tax=Hoplias malabaricus TaxID=27720 RepID=UPI0034631BAE